MDNELIRINDILDIKTVKWPFLLLYTFYIGIR
jgi:hypothetical protein